ncbi:MAG TPA: rhomboid family intramembrane serine protease [Bacteroidia bacterium]|nr:rhomboid family intramembrane serine protease [Bacteroidia bacterium]
MVHLIILVTVILSLLAFSSKEVLGRMIFNPYVMHEKREWWRFVTSGFIHADFVHLFVNMLVLYSFGDITLRYYTSVFDDMGDYYFLLLYFGGMIIASVSSYKKNYENPEYNALGASGAVSAVVFAFILFEPLRNLYIFGVLPIPGILFGALYLVYSYYEAKRAAGYVNHEAHFYGAVFGFAFTLFLKPDLFSTFINSITYFLE